MAIATVPFQSISQAFASAAGAVIGNVLHRRDPSLGLSDLTGVAFAGATAYASPSTRFTVGHALAGIGFAFGPVGQAVTSFGVTSGTLALAGAELGTSILVPVAIEHLGNRLGYPPGSPRRLLLSFSLTLLHKALLPRCGLSSKGEITMTRSALFSPTHGTKAVSIPAESSRGIDPLFGRPEVEGCRSVAVDPGKQVPNAQVFTFSCRLPSGESGNIDISVTPGDTDVLVVEQVSGPQHPQFLKELQRTLTYDGLLDEARRVIYNHNESRLLPYLTTSEAKPDPGFLKLCKLHGVETPVCTEAWKLLKSSVFESVVTGQRAVGSPGISLAPRVLTLMQTYLADTLSLSQISLVMSAKGTVFCFNRDLLTAQAALHKTVFSSQDELMGAIMDNDLPDHVLGRLYGYSRTDVEGLAFGIPLPLTFEDSELLVAWIGTADPSIIHKAPHYCTQFLNRVMLRQSPVYPLMSEETYTQIIYEEARKLAKDLGIKTELPKELAEKIAMAHLHRILLPTKVDCASRNGYAGRLIEHKDGATHWFVRPFPPTETALTVRQTYAFLDQQKQHACSPGQVFIAQSVLRHRRPRKA